mgnify:CR=1 FL=1
MSFTYNMTDAWTDGSTYTAIKMNVTDTSSNAASLLMDLQVGGASKFSVGKGGVITFSGNIIAGTDNTYDIGAVGATRPRIVFVGTAIELSATAYIYFNARSQLKSSANGDFLLQNASASDFGSIKLGGLTSSFPALKRSTTTIQVRLADDSADAGLTALSISTSTAATFHTTTAALTDGAGVATGTLLTAPAAGNPTKWIGINDNGTTRYIPAW